MKIPSIYSAIAMIVAIALTGCAVTSDFHAPESTASGTYTVSPLPPQTASSPGQSGKAQRFAFAQDLSAQWWTLFRSPDLDALISKGLTDNPSLTAAQAALREARENLRAAGGTLLYPAIDAGAQAARRRSSEASNNGSGGEYNLYNASVTVSYTLDLFGGSKRQLEALQAQVDYQRYQYEAAYLTLTANIVTTAVQEASLRAQIKATLDIIAAEQKQLEMVQRQFELGAVAKAAVLIQQSQLAITSATLPPLEKQLASSRHALSVLAGQLPSQGNIPEFHLDSLSLPEVLPVSLPSALARQRPDLRAAEELLHKAGAQVGVATANLYPRITLSGNYGTEAANTGDLFTSPSIIWGLGAGLLQPVFHGGELTAKRRAAIAAYDQAAAQYRGTVLRAFQNVADVLRALDSDAKTLQAQAQAVAASQATLDLAKKQFELGAVSYLALLVAQRDYQNTRIALISAQAARYADTAALFQALGGGWWNRNQDPDDTTNLKTTNNRPTTAHPHQ